MSKPLPEHTFELKRMVRSYERALKDLSDSVLIYLGALDEMVAKRKDVPDDISRWLGVSAGKLEMQNDQIRYHSLGVDFRKDNKAKARAKIIKARSPKPTGEHSR